MSVNTCSDHHDGDITQFANRATQFKTIDTGKHDVDEYDIGRSALKDCNCVFTCRSLVNDPAFVFEGKFDRGSDAFIVLDS